MLPEHINLPILINVLSLLCLLLTVTFGHVHRINRGLHFDFKRITALTTVSATLVLALGGIISGVKACGSSFPFSFRFISHIDRANCSLFNFPTCFMSHRPLWTDKHYIIIISQVYINLFNYCRNCSWNRALTEIFFDVGYL